MRIQQRIVMREAVEARMMRAIEGPRQLQEVMTAFWFNHFNVFAGKGLDIIWTGAFEETAIRPHTFGKFRTLLGATAHHPAMLFYLDNWQNTAPGSPGSKGKFEGINENYARELMELHTLGVNGGYSQADVIALAHILTGWGLPKGGGGYGDGSACAATATAWRVARWAADYFHSCDAGGISCRPRSIRADFTSTSRVTTFLKKLFWGTESKAAGSTKASMRSISWRAAPPPRSI